MLGSKQVYQINYGGVAKLMHLPQSSKAGAQAHFSSSNFQNSFPFPPKTCWESRTSSNQKQKPDRKETGRANDSLSLLLPGCGRQRSGFIFIEQLAYPTVPTLPSTTIIPEESVASVSIQEGTHRGSARGRISHNFQG
jgi:hypothetical protein